MSEEQQRKERASVNLEIIDQVKRLSTTKLNKSCLKLQI